MRRMLVAYFSAGGTTADAAGNAADAADEDFYALKSAVANTQADLNWRKAV